MIFMSIIITIAVLFMNTHTEHCTVSQTDCNNVETTAIRPGPATTDYAAKETRKNLNNVYVSVKSTEKYHLSRLPILLLTWLKTVSPKNIFIVTDKKDITTKTIADYGYNIYYSECPIGHTSSALACKCGDEFKLYYEQVETGKDFGWYCHFDDDMYVNSVALEELLSSLDYEDIHYLGRCSVNRNKRIKPYVNDKSFFDVMKRNSYYFATGASYCISKALMSEIEEYVRGRRLVQTAKAIGTPDDMAVGFVVEAILGYNMTDVREMNSHLNPLLLLTKEKLPKQITISYLLPTTTDRKPQRINLPSGVFSEKDDPTRFFSYHCLLYPSVSWCQSRQLPKLSDI